MATFYYKLQCTPRVKFFDVPIHSCTYYTILYTYYNVGNILICTRHHEFKACPFRKCVKTRRSNGLWSVYYTRSYDVYSYILLYIGVMCVGIWITDFYMFGYLLVWYNILYSLHLPLACMYDTVLQNNKLLR